MKSILEVVQNLLKPYIDSQDSAINNALTNLSTPLKRKTTVTPSSSGKATLRDYIVDVVLPLRFETYEFPASGFSDMPETNWGYAITVHAIGGGVSVIAYRELSQSIRFIRSMDANNNWQGTWTRLLAGNISEHVEAIGATPSVAYASGRYFWTVDGDLYRTTTSVSTTTVLTVGSNCEKVYIATELYNKGDRFNANWWRDLQYLSDTKAESAINVGDYIGSGIQWVNGSNFLNALRAKKVSSSGDYNLCILNTNRIEHGSNYLLNTGDILIEDATLATSVSFVADEVKSYTAPAKTGYTAYVLRPYVTGDWADKFAVIMAYNGGAKFGIWNRSASTSYTWTVKASVMYVKNY